MATAYPQGGMVAPTSTGQQMKGGKFVRTPDNKAKTFPRPTYGDNKQPIPAGHLLNQVMGKKEFGMGSFKPPKNPGAARHALAQHLTGPSVFQQAHTQQASAAPKVARA